MSNAAISFVIIPIVVLIALTGFAMLVGKIFRVMGEDDGSLSRTNHLRVTHKKAS